MRLRTAAPGKVNLCLLLGETREDGRHEVVTLFQPVTLSDLVHLSTGEGLACDVVECPGVEGENLAARALAELRARGWDAPPVRVSIGKRIPVAAGMAGGSADAAAVLRLASAVGGIPDPDVIGEVARVLGADVPSQLAPGPLLGTGAGEVVEPVPPRAPHAFVILPSAERLPTPAVFAEADRLGLPRGPDALSSLRVKLVGALHAGPELASELLVNDLEPAARSLCPSIGDALALARSLGADAALVCGSGPTVAGIFWGVEGLSRAREAAAEAAEHVPGAAAAGPVDADFASVRDTDRQPGPAQ
ncbi:MAG TPA: hypothetical protein VG186_13125 [Solirubrobacteraceae bacterium]|nr:hypothetical protein [Solirubrobacteraceae bacterium]